MNNKFITTFKDLSLKELQDELIKRKLQLCDLTKVENLEVLTEEIEALEFLLKNFETNV